MVGFGFFFLKLLGKSEFPARKSHGSELSLHHQVQKVTRRSGYTMSPTKKKSDTGTNPNLICNSKYIRQDCTRKDSDRNTY